MCKVVRQAQPFLMVRAMCVCRWSRDAWFCHNHCCINSVMFTSCQQGCQKSFLWHGDIKSSTCVLARENMHSLTCENARGHGGAKAKMCSRCCLNADKLAKGSKKMVCMTKRPRNRVTAGGTAYLGRHLSYLRVVREQMHTKIKGETSHSCLAFDETRHRGYKHSR